MEFRIADTFTDSLAKLTNQEQKAVKTTAFDLQVNPAHPSIQLHRIDRSKDDNFWSARVSRDVRLVVHRTSGSFLLCYVDHHDAAYAWAERRKIERHPRTGAAQIVEVRETVREVPTYVPVERSAPEPEAPPEPAPARPLFAGLTADDLLGYGVPPDWVDAVAAATEDTVLDVAARLPAEAAEAVLRLAVGETPVVAPTAPEEADPFEHPDALRRFRTVEDRDELERALDFPWDKWAVFLHPTQRATVERSYNGPARVAGSAGTGKTVVALHRAVHLAEADDDARVLLTTFSDPLAHALKDKLRTLVSNRPRLAERIDVLALDAVALRLYRAAVGAPTVVSADEEAEVVAEAVAEAGDPSLSGRLALAEWRHVVDAWQLGTWDDYRDVSRAGRRTRLPQGRREAVWAAVEGVRRRLADRGLVTMSAVYGALAELYEGGHPSPYDHVVVDEAQDVGVAQLRFLAAMAGGRPDGLFFAGDLGQRIFQPPFSWRQLGVDVRGRSHTLRINYRTSHQIRRRADGLLNPEIADVDGVVERRAGTTSVFNGPEPVVLVADDAASEAEAVGDWLAGLVGAGVAPAEIGIVVRSDAQVGRAQGAAAHAGLEVCVLDGRVRTEDGRASVGTMHLAKGLEFRAVAVMACDDDVVPLEDRVATAADAAAIEEVYDTERHLLYVACTRARDHLMVSGADPASEFLDDLRDKMRSAPSAPLG